MSVSIAFHSNRRMWSELKTFPIYLNQFLAVTFFLEKSLALINEKLFLIKVHFSFAPKALACPRLSKPDYGTILPTNCMYGDTFSGERCFLHCPSGYKALGKRVAVCNNLQWQPKAELQCVPVRGVPTVQLTSVAVPKKQQQPQHQQYQTHQNQQHRATIKCPEDMNVIKPKNQDTVLVRIPKPETNVDWSKYVDTMPIWGKRLETTLSIGATEVTFRARSPYTNQFDICRVIINVVDPSPPTVSFCPDPFVVNLDLNEVSRPIYWKEPTFDSKQPIKQVFKSKTPGYQFGPGVHPITYVASTEEGLSAKCSFRITVKGEWNGCNRLCVCLQKFPI